MSENIKQLKAELYAFKKNNEELIQRHNAAISSWDEERERALREANRVLEWRGKCEQLERENTALREKMKVSWDEISALVNQNAELREQIKALSGENRRLRQVVAAPAMIAWAMHGKDLP